MELSIGRLRGRFAALFVIAVSCSWPQICSAADSTLALPAIFAVRDESNLCIILDNRDSVLYDLGDPIQAPSMSPDGRFITAFLPESDWGFLPGTSLLSSGVETDLLLIDRYARDQRELGEVRFRRVFSPRNIIYASFVPAMWLPDCQRFYVASRDGVALVHVSGTVDSIFACKQVSALTMVEGTTRCAVSNGKAVFLIDTLASLTMNLVDSTRAKKELKGTVRAMCCDRAGRMLAVAHGRQISTVDMSDGSITKWGRMPRDIYWLGWLSNDTGLVVLCGAEDQETALRSAALSTGVIDGSFEIRVLSRGSAESQRQYDQVSFDVRRVTPALSPDGRYLAFASRKNMERGTMMVLPLDGSKAIRVTDDYLYRSPMWGP